MLSVVMMISLCACGEADGNGNSLENDQLTIDAMRSMIAMLMMKMMH